MAEEQDSQEKTEEPTQRKIDKSIEDGQFLTSKEMFVFTSVFIGLFTLVFISSLFPNFISMWKSFFIFSSEELDPNNQIFHWSNSGIISRYDFAFMIGALAEELGIIEKAANIFPIRSSEYPSNAKRPSYSVLDCSETINLLKINQVHWFNALKETLIDYSLKTK